MLPFFKPKKGYQFAGSGLDAGGGGGGGGTSAFANKTDLTAIILTGTTNTSGSTITSGTWFYLNGTPCIAKVDIASGATFTEGTNYEEKTIGSALTELNSKPSGLPVVQTGTISLNQSAPINVEDAYCYCRYRQGVIIDFAFAFTTTSALSGWTAVAQLPISISSVTSGQQYCNVIAYNGVGRAEFQGRVHADGILVVYGLPSNQFCVISGTLMLD